MAITSGGPGPYAPAPAIITTLEYVRQRGFPTQPFSTDVLQKIGITDALAARTLNALKLLDLISDDGAPMVVFDALRRAPEGEYKSRVADLVRDAYKEVFEFKEPTDPGLRDAFRDYTPHGQQDRMVNLFVGLCEYAEIIEKAPKRRTVSKREPSDIQRRVSQAQNHRRAQQRARASEDAPRAHEPGGGKVFVSHRHTDLDGIHPFVAGLIAALPPIPPDWPNNKSVFPQGAREAWTNAALANFNLLYELAPENQNGGETG